ncbi:pyridoxamine 5'-phosphate oxidase family protein [Jidongwangia harbinensis]|uniref:pyridoxamine 5'-phosphate oxidase family protein n=1 Tax=Jidongwangia harbinensis TaxID=2878561 RepID=UPI001CD9F950|nr:pyridoxamine 5'-phosphate oxidase family protein [Jidongwangia harbinensis]MCA2215038.1 pyridoxamine 5'-phosphate oxidase family protein [Jidongwangia harbinensis]
MAALPQGDIRLLDSPAARDLLQSRIPARLAFVWPDGTPRIVATWFHWTGSEIVMATYTGGPHIRHPAARVAALRRNPAVALTVDTETTPPAVLTIRGHARVEDVRGLAPEYVAAAHRYLGDAAAEMIAQMDRPGTTQARIVVRPAWVGLLDFTTRLPSPLGGVLDPA